MEIAEAARLAELHEYHLLDEPADDELEAVVRLAAFVAGVPTATLNLIDANRQCQLTSFGFEGASTARDDSMCAIRFRDGVLVHVPDASLDPVYKDNPWVTGRLADVRFYASAPLVTPRGHALGSLCVFDSITGRLSADQLTRLEDLASIAIALFERRRQARMNGHLAAEAQEQRELAEIALKQAEAQHEFTDAVLETIDVAVVAADAGGRLTLFNRAARDWHGLDADPSIDPLDHAKRYSLFAADGVTPLAPDAVPLHQALHDGKVADQEMVIAPPQRPATRVRVSGRAMSRLDGRLLGAVVAQTDVTAERAQQAALEAAHAELNLRARELERSNGELAQFAAAASHDLSQPLMAVGGYLELLQEAYAGVLDDQAGRWIGIARDGVGRMAALITALLNYARAGGAECARRPADTGVIVEQVLADLDGAIRESGARVTLHRPVPVAVCDPTLLRQLLQNLVANAIKYRDPARPCRVEVSGAEDGTGWAFAVADNGPGIAPERRDRVFRMFTTLEPGAAGGHGRGHGIGLATCQRIVERHGGRIWVEETPGGGATVRFTLTRTDPGQPPG